VSSEKTKNWLESLALFAAGVFFAWKLLTGWLIANLGVEIDTQRQMLDGSRDYLAVTVRLKKGATDTVWLTDVSLRVAAQPLSIGEQVALEAFEPREARSEDQIIHFPELKLLAVQDGQIDWSKADSEGKKLTLSPGESFQLARAFSVPSRIPISVEVAVRGDRTFWPAGFQWHASAIALPVPDESPNSPMQPTGHAGG